METMKHPYLSRVVLTERPTFRIFRVPRCELLGPFFKNAGSFWMIKTLQTIRCSIYLAYYKRFLLPIWVIIYYLQPIPFTFEACPTSHGWPKGPLSLVSPHIQASVYEADKSGKYDPLPVKVPVEAVKTWHDAEARGKGLASAAFFFVGA